MSLHRQHVALALACLLSASLISSTLSASMDMQDVRKFAAKPNDIKKQNQLEQSKPSSPAKQSPIGGGFNWGSLMNVAMQLLMGAPSSKAPTANDKMDGVNQAAVSSSPLGEFSWSKLLSLGLQLILSVLGGDGTGGLEKTDSSGPIEGVLAAVLSYLTGSNDPKEVSVMAKQASELFSLVISLLDTLRTSFTQRSMSARSMGSSDPMADAAVAAATMLKSYVKTQATEDDLCMQKYLCEANNDCVSGTGDTGYLFCQIGTYGMSYMLERTTYTPFEIFNDAGRRGRVGESCTQIFAECNDL